MRAALALALLWGASGCLSAPPPAAVEGQLAVVRAETPGAARELEAMANELAPRILALLPDSKLAQPLEIWMQEELSLYSFPSHAAGDAEGLWAEDHRRILVHSEAENVRRTLCHEMVHAALGPSWSRLPGSMEEGLCDWVAAQLCDDGRARLHAGRLSSAALLCGGLGLELSIRDEVEGAGRFGPAWTTRVLLRGQADPAADDPRAHLEVFRLQAGLSSTRLEGGAKRGLYGLAYLLVHRIAQRAGIEGLQKLCRLAEERGLSTVPSAWLLSAAGLGRDRAEWRAAAGQSIGEEELIELMRMYPEFVVDALEAHLSGTRASKLDARLDSLSATVRLVEGGALIDAADLEFVRNNLRARAARGLGGSYAPASAAPASSAAPRSRS